MTRKRLQILSQFKTPLPLMAAVGIKILLPYENGEVLEKTVVDVIDPKNGLIEFGISDFEIDGFKEEMGQNFLAHVRFEKEVHICLFARGLNVQNKNGKKVWV